MRSLEIGKTYLGAFDARKGWGWTLTVEEDGRLWIQSWAVRTVPKDDPDVERRDMVTGSRAWLDEYTENLTTRIDECGRAQFDTFEELVEHLSGLPLLPVGYDKFEAFMQSYMKAKEKESEEPSNPDIPF